MWFKTLRVFVGYCRSEIVMDCGGKRSATPLWCGRRLPVICFHSARAKALSPLRTASAVHDALQMPVIPRLLPVEFFRALLKNGAV
jgi:hypothetical protein